MVLLVFGDWWSSLNGAEQVFWGISIIFTVLFLIQFVVSLVGLDFDHDADIDLHAEADTGYHLDASFTLFSVRSIIAFFTFFGWTGVLVLNNGGSTVSALGFASLAGFAAMSIVGYMLYAFSKLTQEGNINMKDAVYRTGEVYLMVPAHRNGTGKIHIKLKGSLREVEAITEGEALPTGSPIRIIGVLDKNVMLVEPVREYLEQSV